MTAAVANPEILGWARSKKGTHHAVVSTEDVPGSRLLVMATACGDQIEARRVNRRPPAQQYANWVCSTRECRSHWSDRRQRRLSGASVAPRVPG